MKDCILCSGELLQVIDDSIVSGQAKYANTFYHASKVKKYVCLECGYIQSYAQNPKVFTDIKYRHMSVEEASRDLK